jgi:hypothetical protein
MDFRPRIDSFFSVGLLATSTAEPRYYRKNKGKKPSYKVKYTISGGESRYTVQFSKILKISFLSTSSVMGKITHETVANLLQGGTDVRLSEIGVTGYSSKLTPDFILKDKKVVLELTTSKSSDETFLQSKYTAKLNHYRDALANTGYDLMVLVVSPDAIYTNGSISQESVDALCYRCAAGLGIHSIVESKEGKPLIMEDQTSLQRIMRHVILELNKKTPKGTKHFPIKEIMKAKLPPTDEEKQTAGKIIRKCLQRSSKKSKAGRGDLLSYLEKYSSECRTDKKRICNVPLIIPSKTRKSGYYTSSDPEKSNMPEWMRIIWQESKGVKVIEEDPDASRKEAMGEVGFERHKIQKSQCFNTPMTDNLKEEASETGLWGKSMKNSTKYKDHYKWGKKGFHPSLTPTDDIESFIDRNNLDELNSEIWPSIHPDVLSLIRDAKSMWSDDVTASEAMLNQFSKTELISHAAMVGRMFTEICYCYKYWIKRADFYKKMCGSIEMLVRCVGSHVFVLFRFPKSEFDFWDTGRLGPAVYESPDNYFVDVCSYTEPTIEHFVKAGPYMLSTLVHLQSNMETKLEECTTFSSHVSKTMSGIYLLYLNNKTDSEELVTNHRFLNMTVLEDLDPNPYRFIERLPEMYKSRLTCYLYKRTMQEIERFTTRPPRKMAIDTDGISTLDYDWLRGIFSGEPVSFRQKVNEFYFGYVVSKERGRGSDRNFKIMKKIVEQEYKYIDDGNPLFGYGEDDVLNQVNMPLLKSMLLLFRVYLEEKFGPGWSNVVEQTIVEDLSRVSFYETATLKVASRNYDNEFHVPHIKNSMGASEIKELLGKANPEDVLSRPRVMETMSATVEQYLKDTGQNDIDHIFQMVPWALNKLEDKGSFYSDIFPKPQHGGDREIHVLQFLARIVQMFLERISRTLCSLISSDSLTHPKWKEGFVSHHYAMSELNLPSRKITMGKSADASKWCQRNHASKFAAFLIGVLPSQFNGAILRILYLWTTKIIVFPIQFVANFLSNKNVKSSKTYERMRTEFETGTGIFPRAFTNRIRVRSGMMQGILHYTSSFMHGVIQESMAMVQRQYLSKKGFLCEITVAQGSDDSAELTSISGNKSARKLAGIATIMLMWKEHVSSYLSVYTSRAKSCVGSTDMIEYNSEWSIRKTTIKPTFRWISSCLEVGIVERFIDRIHNFYNTCTSVLEGGGSVLETATVQLCQAWLHYSMLGIGSHMLSSATTKLICCVKDPSVGYFPLDSDYAAGIPGVDFQLYMLHKKTNYGSAVTSGLIPDTEIDLYDEDVKEASISRDLRKVKLKFGDNKIFEKILRRMSVPDLNDLLEEVEKSPELLYYPESSWILSKSRIFMKVFEPGVKESLSKHSATARIMSASAYMISRPCLTIQGQKEKVSLYKALVIRFVEQMDTVDQKKSVESVYVHAPEYAELEKEILSFQEDHTVQSVHLRSRSKHVLVVLERTLFDLSIVELCKQIWFDRGARTGLTLTQAKLKWAEAKSRYWFLSDDRKETCNRLNMSEVQLKNFMESLDKRPRKIVLLDTSARGGGIRTVLSRIFWPNTKLLLKQDVRLTGTAARVRSELFSIMTYWFSEMQKLIEITSVLQKYNLDKEHNPPLKLRRLAIMAKSMTDMPKADLVRSILNDKLGVIGFFTVAQQGWGKNRKGPGEWKGHILSSCVRISFKDSICDNIEVDKVSMAPELGSLLKDFISSCQSSWPEEYTESSHWLTPDGKINGGRGTMKAIPIKVNPSLTITTFEDLTDKPWFLQTSGNVIRLKARMQNTSVTILSEKIQSHEWDPVFEITGKNSLDNWNNSTPILMTTLENELNTIFEGTPSNNERQLRRLQPDPKLKPYYSTNGWDLREFKINLTKFYDLQVASNDTKDFEKDYQEFPVDLDELITGTFDFDWDDEGVFEELADTTTLEDLSQNLLDQAIDDSLELLMSEREDVKPKDMNRMPATNKCFYNVDTLSRALTGVPIRELYVEFKDNSSKKISGVLGKLLTMLTGRDCMDHHMAEEEREIVKLEEESISLIASIKSDEDLAHMSEEVLQENLSYINKMIDGAPDFLKSTYAGTKHNLERVLYYTRFPMKEVAISDFSSAKFLLKCKSALSKSSARLNLAAQMDDHFFIPICRKELDEIVLKMTDNGEISPMETSLYRESISKPILTTLLVDIVSCLCNRQIEVSGYRSAKPSDEEQLLIMM